MTRQPWWQTEPCPSWCDAEHTDTERVEDRSHYHFAGSAHTTVLTLHDAIRLAASPEQARPAAVSAAVVQGFLVQGVRETSPRVEVDLNEDTVLTMTSDQAEGLARHLLELVSLARGESGRRPVLDALRDLNVYTSTFDEALGCGVLDNSDETLTRVASTILQIA